MGKNMIAASGVKNISNMKMVLKTNCLLPCLLLFLVLKYSCTRNFNVLEKSDPTDFVNFNFLIRLV